MEPSLDRPWQLQSYAAQAGLLHQRVFDISFAEDGLVWLAASNGLWRYDGYGWRCFGPGEGLPSRFVRAVKVTRDGELWVGTDAGAGVFDPIRLVFDARNTKAGLPNDNIRHIAEDPDGTLWFSCDQWPDTSVKPGGLAALYKGQWQVYTQADGLPMNYVIGYHRDRQGRQFALTPRGWVQHQAGEWSAPINDGYEKETTVLHLAETADGRLFAQGENHLLTLKRDRWDALAADSLVVGDTRDGKVFGLMRDRERGSLWIAGWNGTEFSQASARLPGPGSVRFYRLREAPDGAIWCVGEGMILRWDRRGSQWSHFAHLPPPRQVDARGRIWFSKENEVWWNDSKGFYRLDILSDFLGVDKDGTVLGRLANDSLVQFGDPRDPAPTPVSLDIEVEAAAIDYNNHLWLWGTDPAGHTRFAHRDVAGAWTTTGSPLLDNRRILSSRPDPRGGLDVILLNNKTTQYEIVWVSGDAVTRIDLGASPPPVPYPQFFLVGDSEFILGYGNVYRRDAGVQGTWTLVTEFSASAFTQVLTTRDEAFVIFNGGKIGGPGGALYKNGKWRVVAGDFDTGHFSQTPPLLRITGRSGLYLQTSASDLDFSFLPLPEEVFVQGLLSGENGELWINTSDGVLRYRPTVLPPDTTIHAHLTEIRGAEWPVRFDGVLPYQTGTPVETLRFSWRFDRDAWSPFVSGNESVLPLQTLKPGSHVLEVRARDADGTVDPSPARIKFTVLPVPLQERAWFPFVVAGLALLISCLIGLEIARARDLRRSNAALVREIAERQQAEAALQSANDKLEVRVQERTAELSTTNESLRHALIARDATEKHREELEQQLHEAQKMQAIGTLAGGIAHDFNNILAVIIPRAQLGLHELEAGSKAGEHLALILNAADRAKHLVQQILAFSRRQKHEFSLIDLRPIIKETEHLLQSSLPASLKIICRIAPKVPPVLADATQMHQILMNLCTNAEYALRDKPGRIVIGLDTVTIGEQDAGPDPDFTAGHYVRLLVEDNGAGMSEAVRQRVCEPFFTTKGLGQGTGLGLAVVHGIVKEHHGVLRIHSELGTGTAVEILLPAKSGTTGPSTAKAPAPSSRGQGETILLLDDEPAVMTTAEALLVHAGFRVLAFVQPLAALEAFRQAPERIDLVVTDLSMPDMNGIEFCREIRRARPDIPVIMTTGFGSPSLAAELLSANIETLVSKPFEAAELIGQINRLLGKRRA